MPVTDGDSVGNAPTCPRHVGTDYERGAKLNAEIQQAPNYGQVEAALELDENSQGQNNPPVNTEAVACLSYQSTADFHQYAAQIYSRQVTTRAQVPALKFTSWMLSETSFQLRLLVEAVQVGLCVESGIEIHKGPRPLE